MVTELEKISMEVASKSISFISQTQPQIAGINNGTSIRMSDLDAHIIDTLGDMAFSIGDTIEIKDKFGNISNFTVEAVENNIFTGFNGAIIKIQIQEKLSYGLMALKGLTIYLLLLISLKLC